VTVRVPITIKWRGGRKLVVAPNGVEITAVPITRHIDKTLVKAVARAFRWRDMLESGTYVSIREIAAAEQINESYVGRVLRLTLLAPYIIEAILVSRQSPTSDLAMLMKPFPVLWSAQRPLCSHGTSEVRRS
jgi:hypothetical protein